MDFEIVIVGSGIAGNITAYHLAKSGFNVGIITKNDTIEESNTFYAQGGIVYKGYGDKPEFLYNDIMNAGAGICNPEALKIISELGSKMVEETLINELNVNFTRKEDNSLDLTDEGAHSVKRIIHSYDTTGQSIQTALTKALSDFPNITFLTDHTVIDIITLQHHSKDKFRMYKPHIALGVYALDNKTKKVKRILSKTVVLATGGIGQVYLHSTNPPCATGDGYAMAARAEIRLINMEYTQFHPTTLYHSKGNNFLISEAVRGEGAILTDRNGNAFMHKYHPQKELAPRDIVTRAILAEMLESGDKFVYLDLSPIEKNKIMERFPYIYNTCYNLDIDIKNYPIPIVPAFHFSCGGIKTDMLGRTECDRLFAVGEVACTGLHGANRLASTSLLEGVVFGQRIAEFITENREDYINYKLPDIPDWIDTGFTDTVDPALIHQDLTSLQHIMWNYVGALRSKRRLQRAITDLKNLRDEIEIFYRDTKIDKRIIELRNAVQTGLIVARQAWTNRESCGAHYRID
jgi:L-aspartate oxidase